MKALILSALALSTNADGKVFSTVRSEEATAVEVDENGNIQHVTEEDVRPPMSDLSMPRPSVISHVQAPIVIVSVFAGPYDTKKDVWRNVASNREDYAEKHGYGYVQFDGLCTNRADHVRLGDASWDALLAIRDVQKRVSPDTWIFWMDPDSSFANTTKELADFVDGVDAQKSLVITGDSAGFNSGHFFIRSNAWSEEFLTDAWSVYSHTVPGHKAQHGMAVVLGGGADYEEKDTWQAAIDKLSGNWWLPETVDKIRRTLPLEVSNAVELVEFRSLASDDDEDFIVHAAGEDIKQSEKILREM